MQSLEKAMKLINQKNTCLIVIKNDNIYASGEKGIVSLLNIISENKNILNNATVADKVVGKAAALLMLMGKIKEVYVDTISSYALEIFNKNNIFVKYKQIVPYIINRTGDGICPMEEAVININSPNEAYAILKKKLKEMKEK